MSWTAYNDAASKVVFEAFKDALDPLLGRLRSNFKVHHMELQRRDDFMQDQQEVVVRIVLRSNNHTLSDGHDIDPLRLAK